MADECKGQYVRCPECGSVLHARVNRAGRHTPIAYDVRVVDEELAKVARGVERLKQAELTYQEIGR